MNRLFLLLLVIVSSVIECRAQTSVEENAATLVKSCEVAVQFPTVEAVRKAPAAEQAAIAFNAAHCLGYFTGILDLNSLYSGAMQTYFCPPKDLPKIEAVKIFLSYAKDHPQFMGEAARSIAVSALADVLPCGQ